MFLAQTAPGFAQQQPGWRKVGDPPPPQAANQAPPPDQLGPDQLGPDQQGPDQQGPDQGFDPQQRRQDGPPPAYQRSYNVGPQLVLPAGSWITVRVNQPLSTDRNQPGDAFTATLAQPLVADGLVIARRGQTVAGRVVESEKSGRVKGTARLVIELTELGLVDGQQIPIQTQMTERNGGTSVGRDAGAIAAGTGVGAAIGGAADGGFGAGVGALAGAAASTIGVLATRGNNAVVYPETLITFRLMAPVTVNTARSEQAFQPPMQDAYEQRPNYSYRQPGPPPAPRVAVAPYYAPYPYYSPYGYYAPYYYGPSLYFGFGRGYGRGYGYGGRYYRR